MSARHGAGGGFSSDVSFAICTSLPNFSSLRSGNQVDAPWMRGSRCRLGALPRSPSRRGSPAGLGFLRYKLGARRGSGGGEDRRESGPGLAAPAPLRFPAGQRRRRRRRPELGIGSLGRRRLRAASLPAALPARWRRQRPRPRQTMNLRARRAGLGRFGPGAPRPGLPEATAVLSGGRPLAAVLAALRAIRALGTPREGLPSGGARACTPLPWLERMQREIGD